MDLYIREIHKYLYIETLSLTNAFFQPRVSVANRMFAFLKVCGRLAESENISFTHKITLKSQNAFMNPAVRMCESGDRSPYLLKVDIATSLTEK